MKWIATSSRRRLLINVLILSIMLGALALAPSASGEARDCKKERDACKAGCYDVERTPEGQFYCLIGCEEDYARCSPLAE